MYDFQVPVIAAYVLVITFGYWLDFLNFRNLQRYGAFVPPDFLGHIDETLLKKTRDYNVEHMKFDFLQSLFNNLLFLLFILVLLNIFNSWITSLQLPFILSGLVFFLLLTWAETFITLPFSFYSTFRIENKYGFNTTTLRLWITDTAKSLAISTLLLGIVITAALLIIQLSPDWWWLWVWGFFLVFTVFMMYISPYVIEPLFHTFTPIEDESLEKGIRLLLNRAGITVSRVFQMDASKRTRHTNAYFTGIGKVKRIVLYDTLIEKMDQAEIMAVLAHEGGHWKKKHVLKYIVATEVIALAVFYVSFHILQSDVLGKMFHIEKSSFFSNLVLLGFIGSILSVPFSPLFHLLSRRHENEADRFSHDLTGSAEGMISALVKLSKDNLSNLHPHPLYALFHYSHPPVLERIRKLRDMDRHAALHRFPLTKE